MARLRRSKLAAGFLLLFQCLSERCQLAGGETPRQTRGKRGRYLPGGAGPGQRRGARGRAAGPGRGGGRPGSGEPGRLPAAPARRGLRRLLRGPRTRRRVNTVWGLGPPAPEGGPGWPRCRLLPLRSPGVSGKSSPLLHFLFQCEFGTFLFNKPAPRSRAAGAVFLASPFPGSPEPPSPPRTRRSCRRRAPLQRREGREGGRETPAPPGARGGGQRRAAPPSPRGPPPARPRRGPAAFPAGSRGRGGKVSLPTLPGRASGQPSPPRKSVARSLPWKPGAERRSKIMEEAPQGGGTCSLGARGSLG